MLSHFKFGFHLFLKALLDSKVIAGSVDEVYDAAFEIVDLSLEPSLSGLQLQELLFALGSSCRL